jgi:hypothetical protein
MTAPSHESSPAQGEMPAARAIGIVPRSFHQPIRCSIPESALRAPDRWAGFSLVDTSIDEAPVPMLQISVITS